MSDALSFPENTAPGADVFVLTERAVGNRVFKHPVKPENLKVRATGSQTEVSLATLALLLAATAGAGAASQAMLLDASGNFAMPSAGIFGLSRAALAAAGADAAGAAAITQQVTAVTASDGAKGVALPAASLTTGPLLVINTVATATLLVYPVAGGNDNINGLAEDLAFTLGPGRAAWFIPVSATQWYTPEVGNASVEIIIPIAGNAKVGATAGWVITGGTDIDHATLPASQTASTLVVGIPGLQVGDVVTAFAVGGQVESAGGNVTLVASLRKVTNVAADNTDAEIATDNVGTLVADTKLSSANLGATLVTPEVMAADEKLYLLLTGTTAGSTDVDITHLTVTVTRVK